jgi:hypothetical protein
LGKVHLRDCLVDAQAKPTIIHTDTEHQLLKEARGRYRLAKDTPMKIGKHHKIKKVIVT